MHTSCIAFRRSVHQFSIILLGAAAGCVTKHGCLLCAPRVLESLTPGTTARRLPHSQSLAYVTFYAVYVYHSTPSTSGACTPPAQLRSSTSAANQLTNTCTVAPAIMSEDRLRSGLAVAGAFAVCAVAATYVEKLLFWVRLTGRWRTRERRRTAALAPAASLLAPSAAAAACTNRTAAAAAEKLLRPRRCLPPCLHRRRCRCCRCQCDSTLVAGRW